ncbi:hypothetical protein F5J12DRAFT_835219 [Pisolithus orientalis]|uniref:uncharacterized protein n=1 Tax=Pisolithus orientalis TaxID=936130 RepID=UPI0022250C25|nr:uncharacterized protein F5J12DRAFT_835219 [Pisolithus orientalis]KAI6005160.1 hypothetical protein F5J12DRAFT_835219 [Pisolithus orientalis]
MFSRTFAAFSLALLVTANAHLEARDQYNTETIQRCQSLQMMNLPVDFFAVAIFDGDDNNRRAKAYRWFRSAGERLLCSSLTRLLEVNINA